jgi:hypothetical protein
MNFSPWSGRYSGRATPSLRDDQTTAKPTGRGSTYPTPIPVQTNPASSGASPGRMGQGVGSGPVARRGNAPCHKGAGA